jgi:uncharacterized RDD family membrane protein YckC
MMRATKGMLGQYAGFFTRMLAFLLDVAILVISTSVITVTITAVLGVFGVDLQQCATVPTTVSFPVILCSVAGIALIVINASIVPLYFIIFWSLSGQTLGDAVMGVRVVRLNGKRMSLWTAIVRYIGYIISLAALGLGFLWILIDDRRQGWHDKLAGTCVIYSWDAQMDERFLWRVARWVERRWSPHARQPEAMIDIAPMMRKYRIAVFKLDLPSETYQVFEVLKKIDSVDPARVLSVSVVQKDNRNQLSVTDATDNLAGKAPIQPGKAALDVRLQAVLDNLPRNRSAVVAVMDQDCVDDASDALPKIEVAVYRVDITPEYTLIEAPEGMEQQSPPA